MLFRKKITHFLLISGILTVMFAATAYAESKGVINGENINVRKEASTDSTIVSKLNNGQVIDIVSAEGDWIKIKQADGSDAFVSNQFVKVTKADAVVIDDGVNIRVSANTDSQIIDKVNAGAYVTATGIMGDFYSIDYNAKTAFIHKDFVMCKLGSRLGQSPEAVSAVVSAAADTAEKPAEKTAAADAQVTLPADSTPAAKPGIYLLVTDSEGINLRKQPSQDAEILAKIPEGDALDIIEAYTEWHKVSYDGVVGFVKADYVTVMQGEKPDNSRGAKVVAYAKQFLGTPYVWGGTNLKKGVDCSGFVYAVMKNFGITLNRSSRDQIHNGANISKDKLKAGDLVFFDTTNATNKGYISHVGIYMGGGQFIHSSSSKKTYCVTISSLSEDYYVKRYVGATRVL